MKNKGFLWKTSLKPHLSLMRYFQQWKPRLPPHCRSDVHTLQFSKENRSSLESPTLLPIRSGSSLHSERPSPSRVESSRRCRCAVWDGYSDLTARPRQQSPQLEWRLQQPQASRSVRARRPQGRVLLRECVRRMRDRLELARREPLSMTLGLLAGEFPSRRIHSRRNGARD